MKHRFVKVVEAWFLSMQTTLLKFRHPRTILPLLICCEIYAFVMFSILWWGGFGATCSVGSTTINWGGDGNSSARTVIPVLWTLTLGVLFLTMVSTIHNSGPDMDLPIWVMDPLRLFTNALLLCIVTVQLFLTGFLLSILTNGAASSSYTIHGCANPVDGRVWIPWSSVGSLLVVALFGHLLIPEKASETKIGWINGHEEWSSTRTVRAISTRKASPYMVAITCLLTLLAVICLWIGFGLQRNALSRTEDGSEWVCNCAGLGNTTLCNTAKASLFDALVHNGGAVMWWVLAGAILLSLFLSLIAISSKLHDKKEWINSKGVRYTSLSITVVSVAVLGFGLGGLWGAPSSYLADLCCPTPNSCISLNNYPPGKWALGAVVLWFAAIISGHYMGKEVKGERKSVMAPAAIKYQQLSLPSNQTLKF